jgi:hypothetical protein
MSSFLALRTGTTDRIVIDAAGNVTVASLAGTGYRLPMASATGVLSESPVTISTYTATLQGPATGAGAIDVEFDVVLHSGNVAKSVMGVIQDGRLLKALAYGGGDPGSNICGLSPQGMHRLTCQGATSFLIDNQDNLPIHFGVNGSIGLNVNQYGAYIGANAATSTIPFWLTNATDNYSLRVYVATSTKHADISLGHTSDEFVLGLSGGSGQFFTNAVAGDCCIDNVNAKAILFGTTDTERMRISAAGGVSIGTTTDPGAGNLLVSGLCQAATAHFGGATDYTSTEADGTVVFNGAATVFDDINHSMSGVKTSGTTVMDIVTIGGNNFNAFHGTTTTVQQGESSEEILHEYKEGSDIIAHIHWMPNDTGAGNVKFYLGYRWFNRTNVMSAETVISVTVAAGGVQYQHIRSDFPIISGTGMKIGSRFVWRVYRDPADVADTYTGEAIALDFGIHFEKDTVGSRQITTK